MPELAEVLYFSKRWIAGLGHGIVAIDVNSRSRVFRDCDVAALESGLAGAKLRASRTHGKQMLFEFSGGRWLGIHLGMTGELRAKPEPYAPARHDHLVLHTREFALVFHDPRQFGAVTFYEGKSLPEFWQALPPQPMDAAFTKRRVTEVLQRHARQPLKALLLDQRYFPGIGNWMADEVMWRMKLPPHCPAGSLSAKQAHTLWRTLRKVCDMALKKIGVDWSDPPRTWLFSHRWERDNNCPRCGAKLRHETLRGRTACWCPVCQKEARRPSRRNPESPALSGAFPSPYFSPPVPRPMKNRLLLNMFAALLALGLSTLSAADTKHILLLAGKPSHGPAQHEHNAGVQLLAKCLKESGLPLEVKFHLNAEWPSPEELAKADTIVMYADGGGGHPALQGDHLAQVGKEMKRGAGFVCLHYAVEVPITPGGPEFKDWLGGYFEPNWSVNPHWDAEFKELPKHAISSGVKPFATNDEWYFHMRFRDGMKDVTPILTAIAPESTMSRKDGPHEGNPAVREAVKNKVPQHTAWAVQREDGGRGFGFSGGHYHMGWGQDDQRKLVLNAIVWSAKGEVPADGVKSAVTEADLKANLDLKPGQGLPEKKKQLN